MDSTRTEPAACTRCATCCRKGGPALHREDLVLFGSGVGLDLDGLVTLRAGEPALDQPRQRVVLLAAEVVKLKTREGTETCAFLDERRLACRIYDRRPAECRALFCRDPKPLARMYETDRIARADLLPAGHPLLSLIVEHDRRCPPRRLIALLKSLARGPDETAQAELAALLDYDASVRRLAVERAGLPGPVLDFLFGRPLSTVAAQCGARIREAGGRLALSLNAALPALELLPEVNPHEG